MTFYEPYRRRAGRYLCASKTEKDRDVLDARLTRYNEEDKSPHDELVNIVKF